MLHAWLILGKYGDVLSTLPIVYKAHKETAKRQNVVISKQYADVLDGIDWVDAEIWEGDWQDLRGAYKWAKRRFHTVTCTQTYGTEFPVEHRTPSWQYDIYSRAGLPDAFDTLPLPLGRPTVQPSSAKTILVADKSESSPFEHADELWKIINFHFSPTHKVIRLSEIKAPNIKDLLPMFDAADAIITVDTSMLHLSVDTKTPVIALAYDGKNRWSGSAWSKRFAFYGRYSEFAARKDELVRVVDRIVNKRDSVRVEMVKTAMPHGYNLSIINHGGKTLMTYRHHPDPKSWRTELMINDGFQESKIVVPKEFEKYSWEDARLFEHNGKLFISYTLSLFPATQFRCVCGYGELELRDGAWTLARHIQPNFGKNNFTALEKNWLFFSHGGKLYAIYGSTPHQTVLELNGDKVVAEHKSPSPSWDYGEIRGGCVIPHNGQLLRFFHSLTGDRMKAYGFRYHVGCLTMGAAPPFNVTAVAKHPIVSGHEGWIPDCPHWKHNVAFPCGVIADGDGWKIGLGINDCQCAIATVGKEHLGL